MGKKQLLSNGNHLSFTGAVRSVFAYRSGEDRVSVKRDALSLLSLSLILLGSVPARAGDNLLPNGDFEEGKESPLHWEAANGLTSFFARDSKNGRFVRMDTRIERKQAMDWSSTFAKNPTLPPPPPKRVGKGSYASIGAHEGVFLDSGFIECEPGQNYRLTADIRGDGKPYLWIKGFLWHPRRKCYVDGYQTRLEPPEVSKERWTTASIGFNPTARSPRVRKMKVRIFAYWPNGIYEFDNIRIEKITQEEMDEQVRLRGRKN